MKCKNFKTLLSDYIDGNLSYGEELEMAEHIRNCKACAEAYEKESAADSRLSDVFGEKHTTDNFTESVISQIDRNYYKGTLTNMKFRIKNHAVLYAFAAVFIACILAAVPNIKKQTFNNFIASFKNNQIIAAKGPQADNNTAFRIFMRDPDNAFITNIYEPLTGKKIAALNPGNPPNYVNALVGDGAYFACYLDVAKFNIKYMTFDGKVKSLDFLDRYNIGVNSFLVSSDNKKIFWSTHEKINNSNNYTIYSADVNGRDTKKIYSGSDDSYDFGKLDSKNENIYQSQTVFGVYDYSQRLYKFNIATGVKTQIVNPNTKDGTFKGMIVGMPNDNSIVYWNNGDITLQDIRTSEEKHYSMPEYITSIGSSQFSPDGRYVVYEAEGSHSEYNGKYVLLDFSTGQSKIIK